MQKLRENTHKKTTQNITKKGGKVGVSIKTRGNKVQQKQTYCINHDVHEACDLKLQTKNIGG